MKFIHISDLHIGKVCRKYERRARSLLEGIADQHSDEKPVTVLTGDIVENGKGSEYATAKDILGILKDFPLLTCPGNHEYGWNGFYLCKNSIQRYKTYIAKVSGSPFRDYSLFPTQHRIRDGDKDEHVQFIGLDSMQGEFKYINWADYDADEDIRAWRGRRNKRADGEIGIPQLMNLATMIAQIKGDPGTQNDKIVVYLHHHPITKIRGYKLRDKDALFSVIRNKVDAVLFGHMHHFRRFEDEQSEYSIPIIYESGMSTNEEGISPRGLPYRIINTDTNRIEERLIETD